MELQNLLKARAALKAEYLLEREKISQLREGIAVDLQREAGAKVRIRVLRNADSLNYQQLLTEGLRGARVRNHEDILAGLMRLRPEQLAQIIAENDLNPTASLYSALCLTPFSVRQIGPVIAPLYPDHKLEDLLKRIRMQG
jgi:hypothetical protein